jgi:D-alanine transaminase
MFEPDQVVYLNGSFVPLAEATVSVLDRGFIYGDGVYELVPVYAREPFRLPHHLARLKHSLDGIGLANPYTNAQWEALVRDIVARHPFADQAVYFQITRGVARRDHAFPKGVPPTVFMMSNPLPISLLGNVLMRQLAAERGAVETVMFRDGYLTEASASNVLIVKDGTIVVPPKDQLILPGITYDAAMEFAGDVGIPLATRAISRTEALAADEMWLSSSTKEVLAITTVDGRPFAGGKPGPVFRKIWAVFQSRKPHAFA